MSQAIDMIEFVAKLRSRPRAKGCVVLTREYWNQKKWSAALAHKTGAEHIHLVDRFAEDEELCSQLGTFLVPGFFDLLKGQGNSQVLIVSGLEFLKATWSAHPQAMNELKQRLETWNKSPALLLVMQFDRAFVDWASRRYEYTFVVDQKETLALL